MMSWKSNNTYIFNGSYKGWNGLHKYVIDIFFLQRLRCLIHFSYHELIIKYRQK